LQITIRAIDNEWFLSILAGAIGEIIVHQMEDELKTKKEPSKRRLPFKLRLLTTP
jgi:hypothetical protein